MVLLDAIVIFAVSLLIGTVAILVGARLLIDSDAGFLNAALTALVGASVWAASSALFEGIPVIGILLMLIIWIGVINLLYPGGWRAAAGIGFVAWIVAVVLVFGFSQIGILSPDALGIPGV